MIETFPRLAVDPVVFRCNQARLQILLVQRTEEPQCGMYGLPGGHSYVHQSTRDSVLASLHRKTNFDTSKLTYTDQLYFFDDDIDPRGHAVSLAYLCLTRDADDASLSATARWINVDELPELAFDHKAIVEKAIQTLQQMFITSTIAKFLVGDETTLNELHKVYEAVLNSPLDNRNFRKKFLSFDVLNDTGKLETGKPYRPSKLYRFKSESVVNLVELKF